MVQGEVGPAGYPVDGEGRNEDQKGIGGTTRPEGSGQLRGAVVEGIPDCLSHGEGGAVQGGPPGWKAESGLGVVGVLPVGSVFLKTGGGEVASALLEGGNDGPDG